MIRRAGGLAAFLLAPVASSVLGTELPPGDPDCDRRMPAYRHSLLAAAAGKRLALDPVNGGRLLYLGAKHTSDPADPQLATFEREMRRFRPTLVLYEGDAQALGTSRRDSVQRYGETGFLRFVARELGVPARSFDADSRTVIAFLAERFEAEEVKIHFALREIWLLRERQGRTASEIRPLAGRIIAGELLPSLPRVLMTEEEFERAFRQRFPAGSRWTEPPARWFDPYGRATGGGFTNRLEQAATVLRDVTMYRTAAHEVRKGERVFAVAGGGHLPAQEPALRCALRR